MFLRIFTILFLPLVIGFPTNTFVDNEIGDTCNDALVTCKTIQTAQSCKAMQPCIQIWEQLKIPEDNNEICDLCKEMVKEARDQLMSNETQEEIKQVFEGTCNLIPIRALAKECIAIVDQLIPTLIETLASRMDPNQVCTVAGLCNNGQLQSIMKSQLPEIAPIIFRAVTGKTDNCKDCQATVNFVKKILKHVGLDVFTQLTFEACKRDFGGATINCEVISKDVIPIVYHYLKSVDPNVFCGAMKSCPLKYPLPKPVGDNLTCEFCETLVQYVRTIFSSASTKEEFRTAFTNMCKDLREFSSECSSLVSEYFDQLYDFVVNQMNPQLVCSALGLCGNNIAPVKMMKTTPALMNPQLVCSALGLCGNNTAPVKMMKTTPALMAQDINIFPIQEMMKRVNRVGLRFLGIEQTHYESKPGITIHLPESSKKTNKVSTEADIETNDIEGAEDIQQQPLPPEQFIHSSDAVQQGSVCTICKAVMLFVDQRLQDQRTEVAIRNALDRVCSFLPQELDDQCKDFVNEYTDMIVTLLIQEVSPDNVCHFLKACPDGLPNKELHVTKEPKGVFCEVCVKVMQYIEKEIEMNATEEAIRKALDKACSYLPKSYATKCQNFMDRYSEMILELLSKEVGPRMVCSMIGICPFAEKVQPNGEIECQICQYTLHYIQDRLMDNATEQEIKQALENACQELPQKLAAECKNYVEQYGDAILALLAQEIDPSVICVKLNICPASTVNQQYGHQSIAIKNLKVDTCSTCQIVVNYLDQLLENDDIDREITKLVEKVCAIVPSSVQEQCTSTIEAYGPYILQMIGQLSDSKEVCQAIDLCARTPGHMHLIGAEKCSFGPTYWCQSPAHASACKAEMYCKQKVWGD